MPRSRRRRQRDRRRESEQRLAAKLVFQDRKAEHAKLGRYLRSVFRTRAGEVVESKDGRKYQVQDDGSLRHVTVDEIAGQEG